MQVYFDLGQHGTLSGAARIQILTECRLREEVRCLQEQRILEKLSSSPGEGCVGSEFHAQIQVEPLVRHLDDKTGASDTSSNYTQRYRYCQGIHSL